MFPNYTEYFSTIADNIIALTSESSKYVKNSINMGLFFAEMFAALNIYYTPVLILIGVLGNLLAVYVLNTSNLQYQSASVYLSAICISDTLFLCQLYAPWVDAVMETRNFYNPGVCYTISYTSYVTCCTSTWLVVAFTVERYVAVAYPLQRHHICTVRRARYIVFFIVCAALVVNIPVFIFVSPKDSCNIAPVYMSYAEYFNVVDTTIVFWIPLAVILVLNVTIMSRVWKLERTRQQLLRVHEQEPDVCRLRRALIPNLRNQHRVTRMLLVVSSVFVLFNLPAYTMRILAYIYVPSKPIQLQRWPPMLDKMPEDIVWLAFQQIAALLFNTTFGMNFMLYTLSGQNFRRILRETLSCFRRRTPAHAALRPVCLPLCSISTSCASAGVEAGHRPGFAPVPMAPQVPIQVHRSNAARRFNNGRPQPQHEEIEMVQQRRRCSQPDSPQHEGQFQPRQVETPPSTMRFLFCPSRTSRHRNSSPVLPGLYD